MNAATILDMASDSLIVILILYVAVVLFFSYLAIIVKDRLARLLLITVDIIFIVYLVKFFTQYLEIYDIIKHHYK